MITVAFVSLVEPTATTAESPVRQKSDGTLVRPTNSLMHSRLTAQTDRTDRPKGNTSYFRLVTDRNERHYLIDNLNDSDSDSDKWAHQTLTQTQSGSTA